MPNQLVTNSELASSCPVPRPPTPFVLSPLAAYLIDRAQQPPALARRNYLRRLAVFLSPN